MPEYYVCLCYPPANVRIVGHTKVRCKQPPAESNEGAENSGTLDNDGGAGGGFDAAPAAGGGDEWESTAAGGGDDWDAAPSAPVAAGGGDSGW